MNVDLPALVVVAHPDDWQIFAGATVYAHIRARRAPLAVVTLTAGEGRHEEYHWKSRFSGSVLSLARALPSWSPYDGASLPGGFGIRCEVAQLNGKAMLKTRVDDAAGGPPLLLYALHLPDGRLQELREGRSSLEVLWPPKPRTTYESWNDLRTTLQDVIGDAFGRAECVTTFAPDPDPAGNPGDHPDHVATGHLVAELASREDRLDPVWLAMYDVQNRAPNIDGDSAAMQRAAMFAYGGGYTAHAAELTDSWRRGWEREFELFGGREYLRRGLPSH